MASKSSIARQYARLVTLWPKDALRPNLPFTRAIEFRASPYGLQPSVPANDKSDPQPNLKSPSLPKRSSTCDPSLEQAQVNALYSLLENRYSKASPLSPSSIQPASSPEHYSKLMEEIQRAPQKTWWQAKLDEWKMKIRWS